MCDLLFAMDPAQEVIPGDHVGLAQDPAGKLLCHDSLAQGVNADVNTAGLGPGNELLHVHNVHFHNIIFHVNSSSNFSHISQEAAELSAGFSLWYNS